ncbi:MULTISPECIES: ankyrin repeat domain-containing protein [unclassified Marinobacter]|uniref:ankyrin repeat domain-containing protein n=1 Tax=unclassified Marinobacter TaxID=83889 RepID=UPI0026E30ABC|nr:MULTISPECIES: ankyrin repeat domain-containing protein [unclassified Marinobacter]MDO6441909.1 ankyrin repeat domain-containing protein [Marinobacter sp. 2_MG-2023]MDO6824706.1 ankyrin repeat domain-containing protein [Marinobacter sp. 1_MG-2023]
MSEHKTGQPQQPENQSDEDAIAFAQGIFELARNGGAGPLSVMLDAGVPVDMRTSEGESLLMLAARNGHADTVALLLEKGANPELQDADGNTALSLAQGKGAQDTIKHLSR